MNWYNAEIRHECPFFSKYPPSAPSLANRLHWKYQLSLFPKARYLFIYVTFCY